MSSKLFALAACLLGFTGNAFSHESDPQVDPEPSWESMRYCQTIGVRAAWGAQARFLGAPAQFKYIAHAPLRKMFFAEPKDIPVDGIYVMDDLNLQERQQYEEMAFYGWKQADKWVQEGRERPEYEVLAALFYNSCKQSLARAHNSESEMR